MDTIELINLRNDSDSWFTYRKKHGFSPMFYWVIFINGRIHSSYKTNEQGQFVLNKLQKINQQVNKKVGVKYG